MDYDIRALRQTITTCPKCNWKGLAHFDTFEEENDDYMLFNLICPECQSHISKGKAFAIKEKPVEKVFPERWSTVGKVFELLGEGGSIKFYKAFDNQTLGSFYYFSVHDSGLIQEDISPSTRQSKYCNTFWEALFRLFIEKPYFHNLHPKLVPEDYRDDILSILSLCRDHNNQEIDYAKWGGGAIEAKPDTVKVFVEI